MIQISGTDATSVAIYVVTPSIRLDGTKASRIHSNRWAGATVTTGSATGAAARLLTALRPLSNIAHEITSTTSTAYPTAQIKLCVRTANAGSSRNGKPSSASMLPALLTAYRK